MSIDPTERHKEVQGVINQPEVKENVESSNLWRCLINWWEKTLLERALETLVKDLRNLAVFELLSLLANITIILTLVSFITGGEHHRRNEQIYQAWQVITGAYSQPGSGGRKQALEFLNATPGTPGRRRWFGLPWRPESLRGVDISNAFLTDLQLPQANLFKANFRNATLLESNFRNAFLKQADFRYAELDFANFQDAYLRDASFHGANLTNTNFKGAILLRTNLTNTSLHTISLFGPDAPFLCKVRLPENISLDANRDCEELPQILKDRFPRNFSSLKDAREFILRL